MRLADVLVPAMTAHLSDTGLRHSIAFLQGK